MIAGIIIGFFAGCIFTLFLIYLGYSLDQKEKERYKDNNIG